MTEAQVLAVIAEVARDHGLWDGALSRDLRLIEDLDLDSLKALTLAVEVENRFRVCLEPEIETALTTVGDLVDTVRRELAP
ncbi:MAG: acyl carrier protein [Acidobacteria bacterium]|jgi:acyl carrier protein|nr:acyl carrier protein [Acidobacteriota bacterium]